MRRKPNRVYVRRERPRALVTCLLLLVTLAAFLRYAMPALRARAPVSAAGSSGAQITREIAFAPLTASLVIVARADGREAARVEAARYVPRGAAGYAFPGDGGYLIAGACYADAAQAEGVAARLREDESIDPGVLTTAAPAVTLRVTGTEAELAALAGGETLLREQTDQLGALAFALDEQTEALESARGKLYLSSRESERAARALEAAAAQDAVAAGLRDLLVYLAQVQEALAGFSTNSPLFFSSKMKYNQIELRLEHIAYLSGLASQDTEGRIIPS